MGKNEHIEANQTVVRRLYDYINENRKEGFAGIVAPSYLDHSNNNRGPDGMIAAAANLHQAYDELRIEITEIVGQGDLVAVQWRETGRHVGRFFNLKPTGQPFEASGLALYRVRDGKIVESWMAIDPATIRAQQAAQRALESATAA